MVIRVYPKPYAEGGLTPLSDGAGEVVELGEDVTQFKIGDQVCSTFQPDWISGTPKDEYLPSVFGGASHGMHCQFKVMEERALMKFPDHLSFEEAATLPCAALNAWHALMHNEIRPVGAGQTVLILGTGGVSSFGIQSAAAARVICISSSDKKLEREKILSITRKIQTGKNK